jgi:hypothetical protein
MDYFQGVVTEFLRAKRSTFVNTEYMIQLDPGNVYAKGRHWFCDAVAIDHSDRTVHLCEVTYSKTQHSLVERLQAWSSHWPGVTAAIRRDSALEGIWHFQPRLFVPEHSRVTLLQKIALLKQPESTDQLMPTPVITTLEEVLPWLYRSWNGERYQAKTDA